MILRGHEAAWAEWRAALGSERMHHAWILAGPRGIGKGAFARAAAAALVAEPGVSQPPVDRHPDILIPEHPPENKEEEKKRADGQDDIRRKRSIPIDEIRSVQHRLTTRPTLGTRRAVIVDPADDLEKGAVNALLKSLEEPPVGTYFLLVAHRPGRLLPTIRSRCRTVRFAPLSDAEVAAVLCEQAPEIDADTREAAVVAAQGAPGVALEFVSQDLGTIFRVMEAILARGDEDFAGRGQLASEIGARPDRERLFAVVELARAILSGNLARVSRAQQGRIIAAHAELVQLSAQLPTFNFDPGLVAMEIGGLLAAAAMPREAA